MPNKINRTPAYIRAILKYCQDVLDIQATFGSSYDVFVENKGYQYAVSFCIEQIGETAKKLRDEGVADKYPNVQWNEIAGMRNRIAHGYQALDLEMIFDIAVDDIPKLLSDCQHILLQETQSVDEKINLAQALQGDTEPSGGITKDRELL